MPTLYIVSTPIGNLEDISLRALRVLREVSLIAVEDTRHARKLLNHFEIKTRTISYHEHIKYDRLPAILRAMDEGDVALISDAGTPGLSDPGYELIAAAIEAGHNVTPLPGANAVFAALVVSGLPFSQFTYLGFAPRKSRERLAFFAPYKEAAYPIVFYEAPHRLLDTLRDMESVLGASRRVVTANDLTKLYEEVRREMLAEAIAHFTTKEPRGEYTVVIAAAESPLEPATPPGEDELLARLHAMTSAGESPTGAIKQLASETGLPRRQLYDLWLHRSPARES